MPAPADGMDFETRAAELLSYAQRLARTADSWTGLWSSVYGRAARHHQLFPNPTERLRFSATREHELIGMLIDAQRDMDDGIASSPTAKTDGHVSLSLPAGLHASLVEEAEAEGVTFDQLCLMKLAAPAGRPQRVLSAKPGT